MEAIQKAKAIIDQAEALLITAGAGMGVDSGLPDFRGNEGFWRAYPPIKKLGLSFAEMANPVWFDENPHLAWGFYGHRLELYRKTVPHSGFSWLLDLARTKKNNYFIYTSNVDGQFQKAGFDPEKIYEVHGSIHHLQCTTPCRNTIWENKEEIPVDMERLYAKKIPECPHCGSVARPNILMFGDWNFIERRAEEQSMRLSEFLRKNEEKKMVIIEMGAGGAIPTVRHFGEHEAQKESVTLIRINPREAQVDGENISLAMGAKEALEKLLQ